jgi:hypothetical protein
MIPARRVVAEEKPLRRVAIARVGDDMGLTAARSIDMGLTACAVNYV